MCTEQGYQATEPKEKRVLDMQPKVMTQAYHVVIPRPIVDNIQPEGQRMRCACHVVVPSSSVVDNIQPEDKMGAKG